MDIQAAVAHGNKQPLALETVQLDEPQAGEILVRIVASGICHTDLTLIDFSPLPWPAVLGHEGAGVVERVGAGVTKVKAGDHVIMSTTSCGRCRNCLQGQPSFCLHFQGVNMSGGRRPDGSCTLHQHGKPAFGGFFGQSSFATYVLAGERNTIKIDKDLPLDVMAPFGCGVQTGAAAVLNTLKVKPGRSLAVFGAGAVGLSALMAAKIAGCGPLIAVDTKPSRLALASELGATTVINASEVDAVAELQKLGGVDYAVEAAGVAAVMTSAIASLGFNGEAVLVREAIASRTEDIEEALHQDLRKPKMGTRNAEINSVFAEIDTAVAELASWMEPEVVEPSPHFAGNRTYIQYEPRGVVLLLGPWNFPFSLVFAPLVPIIAAGNACIVKPNELQPHTSALVADIIASVFPEEEVVCFQGGVALAEALQQLPFDHVFFTGSPAVGKRVMAAAARHLSSVTLELGGKCPAILDDSYPIADAAAKIAGARFNNAGQLCLSVDHVWAPKAREEELVAALRAVIARMFYVEGALQTDRLARIVDRRNFARVKGYVDEAAGRGAKVVIGGEVDEADLTIHPTVLLDPPLDTRIMREEIFGPVLPIIGYNSIDEAVDQIDETGKPLAMYIFSHDKAFVNDVLDRSSSGGVTVNHVLMHYAENRLPFGGVNGSGMGRYKGVHGFHELSNARSVFVQAA